MNRPDISDYLRSSCRAWEEGCDNESATAELAGHLYKKFSGITNGDAFDIASEWTGYVPMRTQHQSECVNLELEFDELVSMLAKFTLTYNAADNKDLPNDASEYVTDFLEKKNREKHVSKELNEVLDSLGDKAYSAIRSWLFKKANSFAPDVKAVRLHMTCNTLVPIIEELEPDFFKD